MSKLLIHRDEWVVVCDGAKALVLQNAGDAKFPNLKTIKVFEQKDLATHDLGADDRRAGPLVRPVTAVAAPSSRPTGTTRPNGPFSRNWSSISMAPSPPARRSQSSWPRRRARSA